MKTKAALLASSQQHKNSIKNELKVMSDNTTAVTQKILIAGGVVFGAYMLYKMFFEEYEVEQENKEGEKKKEEGSFARIGKVLSQQALLFLLHEGRERIQNYLDEIEVHAKNIK